MNQVDKNNKNTSHKNHHSSKARNDLTPEHPFGDTGQSILAIGLFILLCLDRFVFHWFSFLIEQISGSVALLFAIPFMAVGIFLGVSSHKIVFGTIRDPPSVISEGIFNHSRNPMYLGVLLFYTGIIIMTLSLVGAIYLIGIIFFYNYIVRYEEKSLEKKFGSAYISYKAKVSRWISF